MAQTPFDNPTAGWGKEHNKESTDMFDLIE